MRSRCLASSFRSTLLAPPIPSGSGPRRRISRRLAQRRPADAGRLLPDRRRLSPSDRASRASTICCEQFASRPCQQQRRLSVEIRLALYEKPDRAGNPRAAAGGLAHAARGKRPPGVVRSSALIEDRAGANFAGQFESFLGIADETEFLTAVRACWAALWTSQCAPLHGQSRTLARRHRDGGADPAADRRARLRRRL